MNRTIERSMPVPRSTYAAGDIVTLASGGPDMTVLGVCPDCDGIECAWFNFDEEGGWTFFNEEFPAVALELAE